MVGNHREEEMEEEEVDLLMEEVTITQASSVPTVINMAKL